MEHHSLSAWSVAVDAGERHTNFCFLEHGSGKTLSLRIPAGIGAAGDAALRAPLETFMAMNGLTGDNIAEVICGTSTLANAVLRGRAPKTALLVTKGFKDILFPGKPENDGLPPIKREDVYEVSERMLADGRVLSPLDEGAADKLIDELSKKDFSSVAVCFLHAYKNSLHEQKIRDMLEVRLPGVPVTLSSEIMPVPGECARSATAVVNAALTPLAVRYIDNLEKFLPVLAGENTGVKIVTSWGGLTSPQRARKESARIILSSPAGGAMACAALAGRTGRPNMVALDIGESGTRFSFIHNRQLQINAGSPAGCLGGVLPAAGINILAVGGDAAGNRSLGRISGGVAGALADTRKTEAEIRSDIEKIHDAIKYQSGKYGHDLGEFVLAAFGGAGPLYAAELALRLGISRVIVPAGAGLFSALGMLMARQCYEQSAGLHTSLVSADPHMLDKQFEDLERKLRSQMHSEGVAGRDIKVLRSMDMCYAGFSSVINMSAPAGKLKRADLILMNRSFILSHKADFGFCPADTDTELVRLKVTACTTSAAEKSRPAGAGPVAGKNSPRPAPYESRGVVFGGERIDTPVFSRVAIRPADSIKGPALIEEECCAALVWPGMTASADSDGNIVINVEGANGGPRIPENNA